MMKQATTSQAGVYSPVTPSGTGTAQYRQLLATAVTMRIAQLKATGGPTVAQAQAITGYFDQATDAPLYPLPGTAGKQEGPTTTQITEALAVLAFIPGGIYALGMYCQASTTPPVMLYSDLLQ